MAVAQQQTTAVTVTTVGGHNVDGLIREDFVVRQAGVERRIADVARERGHYVIRFEGAAEAPVEVVVNRPGLRIRLLL